MFRAKHDPLLTTQNEHLKLAGTVALLWGNADFAPPPCNLPSFVTGIALHDRGYGVFDTLIIGEISETQWLDVSRKSFFATSDDTIADLIVKHHLLRLVRTTRRVSPAVTDLRREMEETLSQSLAQSGLDPSLFTFIDRITDMCDSVSFDFCQQDDTPNAVAVQPRFTRDETIDVRYAIEPGGVIRLAPWPLSVPTYTGYLIGYQSTGFPDAQQATLVPFTITP